MHKIIEPSCCSISLSLQSCKNRNNIAQSQLLSSLVMQSLIYLVFQMLKCQCTLNTGIQIFMALHLRLFLYAPVHF